MLAMRRGKGGGLPGACARTVLDTVICMCVHLPKCCRFGVASSLARPMGPSFMANYRTACTPANLGELAIVMRYGFCKSHNNGLIPWASVRVVYQA